MKLRLNGKKTGNWKSDLKFGTWNMRTLYKAGVMKELVEEVERYIIKCLAKSFTKSEI